MSSLGVPAIPAGVVGAGPMGRRHALAWAATSGARLVGIADLDPERAESVAREVGTRAYASVEELLVEARALSVAVSTRAHFEVARRCLEQGADVLVEKPLAPALDQARELCALAEARGRVLMVGHTERFNPVVRALDRLGIRPRFIEAHRLAPFTERGTDVDVILDLMIHDLDLLLHFVDSEVRSLDAAGVPVLTGGIDIANVRIRFASGAVANLTASRVSAEKVRKVRFFEPNLYVSLDTLARSARAFRLVRDGATPRIEAVDLGELPREEPLTAEVAAFLAAVRGRSPAPVTGRQALAALEVAHRVRLSIEENGGNDSR